MKFLFCACAIIAIAFSLVPCALAADEGVLDELIQRQNKLKSVRAKFVQEKYDPMLGRPIKSEGDFYFRAGVGVRWEYEDTLVIYDGNILYVYSPEMKEAEKIRGSQGFMGPLAFDIKYLADKYEMQAMRSGEDIVLNLKPKEEMPFESMRMLFAGAGAFPSEVSLKEATGDSTAIKFEKVKINATFDDKLLIFNPPAGTVIRERQLE